MTQEPACRFGSFGGLETCRTHAIDPKKGKDEEQDPTKHFPVLCDLGLAALKAKVERFEDVIENGILRHALLPDRIREEIEADPEAYIWQLRAALSTNPLKEDGT